RVGGALAAFVLTLPLASALPAVAATFTINPIQVFLSDSAKSGLITLQNTSPGPLRFQLSVFAWAQATDGSMVLAPTRDVVFFPKLLTLAPGEERKIRVGASTPAAATEKTYRLFVEELPSADQANPATGTSQIRVLTRAGIPIFVRPAKPVVTARIEGVVA